MHAPEGYKPFETLYLATDGRSYGNELGQWGDLKDATYFHTAEEAQKIADQFRVLWGRYTGVEPETYVVEVMTFIRRHKE